MVVEDSGVLTTTCLQAMRSLNSVKCRNLVAAEFGCTGKADRLLREAMMVELAKDTGAE
jgi:hypothetical protein